MRQEVGKKDKTTKEFEELLLEVRRVTRVTTGGRRMSFRATVLIGNKNGKIGLGISKGSDVTSAVKKASNEAFKNIFEVPLTKDDTVPYPISLNYKACLIKILPASAGTGVKAGSSVRSVLELAGYANVLSKIIGSNNKLNNAVATIKALTKFKHKSHFAGLRVGKGNEELVAKKTETNVAELKTAETKTTAPAKKAIAPKATETKTAAPAKKATTKAKTAKSDSK